MWFICALGQQLNKAIKVIRNEKKEKIKRKKKNNRQKVVVQFSLEILICSFLKTICNLRIAKPYFAPRAHTKGESGTFGIEKT